MAKTIDELKAQSAEVKNATVVGENTATRVGTLFTDIVEHIEQVNTAIETEKNRAMAAEQAIIYDVSALNGGAVFESLSALLSSSNLDTLIPVSFRHGGMTIRYVQSSDNKYVQYRCIPNKFTTDVTKWQGVDDEPTAGSDNLVKSGGIFSTIKYGLKNTRTSIEFYGIYPVIKKDGTDVIITFDDRGSSYIHTFDYLGNDKIAIITAGTSYTLPTDKILVLKYTTYSFTVSVENNNYAFSDNEIMLAFNRQGVIAEGVFAHAGSNVMVYNNLKDRILSFEGGYTFSIGDNNSININCTTVYLYLRDTLGVLTQQKTINNTTFNIPHNNILVWNIADNTLSTELVGTYSGQLNKIILFFNRIGVCCGGELLPYYESQMSLNSLLFNSLSDRIVVVENAFSISHGNNETITFNCTNAFFYLRNNSGINVKSKNIVNTTYNIEHNNILVWDISSNSINTVHINNYSGGLDKIVLLYNRSGIGVSGALLPYFTTQYIKQYSENNYRGQVVTFNTFASRWSNLASFNYLYQGGTIAGNRIILFSPSNNNHSDYGTITFMSSTTFEVLGSISHNIGHCNSVSYNSETDSIIIANSGNGTIDDKNLYIINNVSQLQYGSTLDYTDCIIIDLSSLNGIGLNACFGEDYRTIYINVNNSDITFYKLTLGLGTTDYSEVSGGYGTYISGKSANEYNGTIKLIGTFTGVTLGTSRQGMCFWDGYLYVAVDKRADNGVSIYKTRLINNNHFEFMNEYKYKDYQEDGSIAYHENQCVFVMEDKYLVMGVIGVGLIKHPLY